MTLSICVFCASSDAIAQRYIDLASEVGTEIARRGHVLVTGGGSVSSMGAVARAARAGGAWTVGIIPRGLLAYEVADEDADELVVTEDMRTRKGTMDDRADAFITLPGGLGTLEELLEIWVARTLRMHDKPVVVCDPDGAFAHLRAQVDQIVEQGFARPTVLQALTWVRTPAEALDVIEAEIRAGTTQPAPTDREVLEAEP
ncbi:MAG: hypothetical protein QOG53_2827 [Frankiales bacterium]|nr:hypothetical protein [Frankiales bacterium]